MVLFCVIIHFLLKGKRLLSKGLQAKAIHHLFSAGNLSLKKFLRAEILDILMGFIPTWIKQQVKFPKEHILQSGRSKLTEAGNLYLIPVLRDYLTLELLVSQFLISGKGSKNSKD